MPQLLADGDKAGRLLEAELETLFESGDLLPHERDVGFEPDVRRALVLRIAALSNRRCAKSIELSGTRAT
jgi:hypothetical protein